MLNDAQVALARIRGGAPAGVGIVAPALALTQDYRVINRYVTGSAEFPTRGDAHPVCAGNSLRNTSPGKNGGHFGQATAVVAEALFNGGATSTCWGVASGRGQATATTALHWGQFTEYVWADMRLIVSREAPGAGRPTLVRPKPRASLPVPLFGYLPPFLSNNCSVSPSNS